MTNTCTTYKCAHYCSLSVHYSGCHRYSVVSAMEADHAAAMGTMGLGPNGLASYSTPSFAKIL